ncbi:hypothetical protein EII22_04945 [Coriobacteriales bacterium OH1046]|nr:hypothetical protein EII22_04945 [Coriobacteriales bacterium OH1046]
MSGIVLQEKLCLLIDRGPAWLDRRITLRECSAQILSLRSQAARIGRRWAERVWDERQSAQQNLFRLGITQVRWMSPMEELAYPARAIYDPTARAVLVHRFRIEEMADVQRSLGLELFSREDLYRRLLAHECFHHIEDIHNMRLDDLLLADRGSPAALRDVGAHAFSNAIFGSPPCQAVDLLWMAVHRPEFVMQL